MYCIFLILLHNSDGGKQHQDALQWQDALSHLCEHSAAASPRLIVPATSPLNYHLGAQETQTQDQSDDADAAD